MTFQGLYQDFYFKELIDGVWGEKYVSLSTRELLHRFHVEWKKYVNATTYGDSFFVFFDSQYRDLVERTLIPALISLESDFKINDVIDEKYESVNKFIPIGEKYNPQVLPDESTILRLIDMIYKELLWNKKITKPYMGD